MIKKYSLIIGIVTSTLLKAQVGIGTVSPSSSSILELSSTNKGLALSTVALTDKNSTSPFVSHNEAMWVYNSSTSGTSPNNVTPGLYYNNGEQWVSMTSGLNEPRIGDIKASFLTSDSDGWYKLDGRSVSGITSSVAQTNATNIGLTILHDTRDRMIKGKNNSESFAATGGTYSYKIERTNLPNIIFKGKTLDDGAHTHDYVNRGGTYWNYNSGSQAAMRYTDTETRTTGTAGEHTHTFNVPSGGSGTEITQVPKNIIVQYFIYLGK